MMQLKMISSLNFQLWRIFMNVLAHYFRFIKIRHKKCSNKINCYVFLITNFWNRTTQQKVVQIWNN